MAKAKALVFACFLLLVASAAEARSLGGGKSFGSRKHPDDPHHGEKRSLIDLVPLLLPTE
jgi:hypothetical protein